MKVLIIEDEKAAQRQIISFVKRLKPDWEILEPLDTVKKSIQFFLEAGNCDIILSDVQLADGLSFEIFEYVNVDKPVIFTTAFDEYAIKAFKTNSVDYLLKPLDIDELEKAIEKFERKFKTRENQNEEILKFHSLFNDLSARNYRNRYLIKVGEKLHSISTDEILYFFSESKFNYIFRTDERTFIIDKTMDQIAAEMDPEKFFRINRSFILNVNSIEEIIQFSNSRLKVRLKNKHEEIVSRERVQDFKIWLDK